jgi:hypothetical protein
VKMLEETGAKVAISTVKRVLYQHNQNGCSARKKPQQIQGIGVAITKP